MSPDPNPNPNPNLNPNLNPNPYPDPSPNPNPTQVVAEMEAICPKHCIIASNTSTLPIADIASKAARPENIVGMHYFSPVDKMPLLEVIPHKGTSKQVIAAAVDVGIKQGKTVVVVGDVPGFYVNRCLGPTIAETVALVQQGADPMKLNKALTDFGYPVSSS
jgi:enoyl-CoA hydratase/long-chain 3-hydroxyacyl-CoA dehydrogenase